MRFDLDETSHMLRESVRDFASKEIAPLAAQIDQDNVFPQELWKKQGDMGLLGITVEEEFGLEEEESGVDEELIEKLRMPIQNLELSVRASNCLEAQKVETVGDLARLTEADLLRIRSFGKTSMKEIKRKLAEMGLSLGMTEMDIS